MLLTRLAVHRPVTTMMASVIVVLLGWMALTRLRVDLMPDTDWPIISVTTLYPGAGPEEIETLITRPMEQAIGSVQGVIDLSSQSMEGSSNVRVEFAWGSELDSAVGDIRARLERLRPTLPPGIEPPYIRKYDSSDESILYLGLKTDLPPVESTLLAENRIAPLLEQVDGVARIRVRGGTRREIQVDLDRQKLESLNMSVIDVLTALESDNVNQPAGDLDQGHLRMLVRSRGEFTTLDQIGDTVVRQRSGRVVRIRDIGSVVDGEEERTERTRVNGVPGLLLYVNRQSGSNTIEVSDGIRKVVEEINTSFPNIELTVRTDKSDYIRQAISNVREAALLGTGLAVIVLLVVLRSFRSTVVIAITMPLSVLATFVLIYFSGFSLNMISFGGLALGIGLLVDNSIVVIESIFRKREEGVDRITAAIEGTQEVSSAIIASTLTTLVVFLPLLFISDRTGIMLRELAAVVSFSLMCSLIASLTLTPMLTARWLSDTEKAVRHPATRLVSVFHGVNGYLFGVVERLYTAVLGIAMRAPMLVSIVLILAVCISIGLSPRIGTEFLPNADAGRLMVDARMAPGILTEILDAQSKKIEASILNAIPEATTIATYVGDDAEDSEDWNEAWFSIHLVGRGERQRGAEEIRKELVDRVGMVPGMKIKVRVRNDQLLARAFRRNSDRLFVEIRGHDPKTADEYTDRIVAAMNRVPGLINVEAYKSDRRPEVSVRIDRAKANSLGISVSTISQTMETAIRGTRSTVFREDGDEFNVLVRLRESDRSQIQDLDQVGVATPQGRIIPLKNLVTFTPGEASAAIYRRNRQRVTNVGGNVEDRSLGDVAADLERELQRLPPVDGFSIRVGGDWEDQQKSFAALTSGFIIAVLLMYMVMASQFESFRDPLLILISLPLGAIGVVGIMLATETTLNVQSFIGLIMLAGIVVNNAIVLIDYMNQLRRRGDGLSIDEIARQAATRRFRPILMTTLTTVLAMLPISLGLGDGGELQAPMARVVIGGLTSATLITLLAIPLAWRAVHRDRRDSSILSGESNASPAHQAA
jgi:HAE1 family hydrophobic/amphiphilic exporter-1